MTASAYSVFADVSLALICQPISTESVLQMHRYVCYTWLEELLAAGRPPPRSSSCSSRSQMAAVKGNGVQQPPCPVVT